ncbi:uncharacterized protein GBIM_00864, partial [Gryllus bimaculatus]
RRFPLRASSAPAKHQRGETPDQGPTVGTSPSLTHGKRTGVTSLSHDAHSIAPAHAHVAHVAPTAIASPQRQAARQRNVRTFRRILLMMAVSLVLRAPAWAVTVFLFNKDVSGSSVYSFWRMKLSFSLLNVLSSALSPLLYCFPDQTMKALRWVFCCREALQRERAQPA